MPKVASSTEEEVTKAPRKRAPRRTVATKDTATPRVRKSRVTKEPRVPVVTSTESERRAPTRLPDSSTKSRKFTFRTAIKIFIPLVILGSTVWIGFSDSGQIDVSAKISDRNSRVAAGENASGMVNVPVQNAPTVPNGGLIGQGVLNTSQNLVPVSQTASTSSDTATTTVSVIDEGATTTEATTPATTENETVPESSTEDENLVPEDNSANPPVSS